jgi:isoleucyl-tRNA synthetase
MAAARRVVALGRAARNAAAVKNRQPLREVVVVDESSEGGDLAEGVEALKDIVLDELNVKSLRFGAAEDVTHYDLKPNLGVVGPKYGRRVPGIRQALAEAPPSVGARAAAGEAVTVEVEGEEVTLSPEELLVEPTEREGFALAREGGLSVALDVRLDGELEDEGLVRELVHKVQNLRRDGGFEIEEGISVGLRGNGRVAALLGGRWGEYFKTEVLARSLELGADGEDGFQEISVDGEALEVRLRPVG